MSNASVTRAFVALAGAVSLLAVTGCVSPSARIATSLERYGFQPAQSRCVGDRLEARLSIGQLQELGRAARASQEDDATPGRLTVGDFLRVAGQIRDPKVPLEVGKAAVACGILADAAAPPF